MKKRLGKGYTEEVIGQGSNHGSRVNETSPLKPPPDGTLTAPRSHPLPLSVVKDPNANEEFVVEPSARSRPPFRVPPPFRTRR